MALGSTQPLTEICTRNFPGGKKPPARRVDNLTAIFEPNEWKCGTLNLSQPSGPPQPVQWKIYLYLTYPCKKLWRPKGLWDVEVPTFSRQSAHRWWCQTYEQTPIYSPGRFLVLISLRGWVDPSAIMQLEGLGQLTNPVISTGNVAFRLAA
jgi:hypothetical protein